jgi:hypothetical protein
MRALELTAWVSLLEHVLSPNDAKVGLVAIKLRERPFLMAVIETELTLISDEICTLNTSPHEKPSHAVLNGLKDATLFWRLRHAVPGMPGRVVVGGWSVCGI